MSQIIGGFATSHATALVEPARWDGFRDMVRDHYRMRYGDLPPEQPQVATESDEEIERRYAAVRDTHELIIAKLRELRPDAVILFGNDQNENFGAAGAPQFAIYSGKDVVIDDYINKQEKTYQCAPDIANAMLEGAVERGFDVTRVETFSGGKMSAHAHAQVFGRLLPDADIPVIPVFINAITPPLPLVKRVFAFGKALAESIDEKLVGKRIVVGASGGLSHFTAGYPYELLTVQRGFGEICADFDRGFLEWVENAELSRVADISEQDILDNGDVEFRQGIAFLGTLPEGLRPGRLVYETFYRGLLGMWAGYWEVGQ